MCVILLYNTLIINT
jgi:hypothetical protein